MQQDLEANEQLAFHKNVVDMSDEEKNFYYFKLHDADNNGALDGLELIQAATHHAHDERATTTTAAAPADQQQPLHQDEDAQTIAEELTHIVGKCIERAEARYAWETTYNESSTFLQMSSTTLWFMQILTMTAC